jgi:hypothetical protein
MVSICVGVKLELNIVLVKRARSRGSGVLHVVHLAVVVLIQTTDVMLVTSGDITLTTAQRVVTGDLVVDAGGQGRTNAAADSDAVSPDLGADPGGATGGHQDHDPGACLVHLVGHQGTVTKTDLPGVRLRDAIDPGVAHLRGVYVTTITDHAVS